MQDGRVFVYVLTPRVGGTHSSNVDVVEAMSRRVRILRGTVDSLIQFPSVSDPSCTAQHSGVGALQDRIGTENYRICTRDRVDGTTDGAGLPYSWLCSGSSAPPTDPTQLSCRRRRDHRAYAELFLDAVQAETIVTNQRRNSSTDESDVASWVHYDMTDEGDVACCLHSNNK